MREEIKDMTHCFGCSPKSHGGENWLLPLFMICCFSPNPSAAVVHQYVAEGIWGYCRTFLWASFFCFVLWMLPSVSGTQVFSQHWNVKYSANLWLRYSKRGRSIHTNFWTVHLHQMELFFKSSQFMSCVHLGKSPPGAFGKATRNLEGNRITGIWHPSWPIRFVFAPLSPVHQQNTVVHW